MNSRLYLKEILAWLALGFGLILLTVAASFAQEPSQGNKQDRVRIKIEKSENGKVTSLDTSFYAGDEETIRKVLKDLGIDEPHQTNGQNQVSPKSGKENFPENRKVIVKKTQSKNGTSKVVEIDFDELMEGVSKELRELKIEFEKEFAAEMEIMKKDLKKCGKMKMVIEDDSSAKHFNWNFNYSDDVDSGIEKEVRVIIKGDPDENVPTFEKEIVQDNGTKVFIFKREYNDGDAGEKMQNKSETKIVKKKENETKKDNKTELNLDIYPNPAAGRFSIKLHSGNPGKLLITVYDTSGKQVYKEERRNFSGNYSDTIDLTKHGSGNYVLKVKFDDEEITRKLIVE